MLVLVQWIFNSIGSIVGVVLVLVCYVLVLLVCILVLLWIIGFYVSDLLIVECVDVEDLQWFVVVEWELVLCVFVWFLGGVVGQLVVFMCCLCFSNQCLCYRLLLQLVRELFELMMWWQGIMMVIWLVLLVWVMVCIDDGELMDLVSLVQFCVLLYGILCSVCQIVWVKVEVFSVKGVWKCIGVLLKQLVSFVLILLMEVKWLKLMFDLLFFCRCFSFLFNVGWLKNFSRCRVCVLVIVSMVLSGVCSQFVLSSLCLCNCDGGLFSRCVKVLWKLLLELKLVFSCVLIICVFEDSCLVIWLRWCR